MWQKQWEHHDNLVPKRYFNGGSKSTQHSEQKETVNQPKIKSETQSQSSASTSTAQKLPLISDAHNYFASEKVGNEVTWNRLTCAIKYSTNSGTFTRRMHAGHHEFFGKIMARWNCSHRGKCQGRRYPHAMKCSKSSLRICADGSCLALQPSLPLRTVSFRISSRCWTLILNSRQRPNFTVEICLSMKLIIFRFNLLHVRH